MIIFVFIVLVILLIKILIAQSAKNNFLKLRKYQTFKNKKKNKFKNKISWLKKSNFKILKIMSKISIHVFLIAIYALNNFIYPRQYSL